MSTQLCGCDPELPWVCERHAQIEQLSAAESPLESGSAIQGVDGYSGDNSRHYVVKDSGQRQQFDSGMVRDVTNEKIDYSLALDGPMFERLAIHLTKGAKKYSARNWLKATGNEEAERFKQSAVRHFIQWYRGDQDEDHAAAVLFNINGYEYVRERLRAGIPVWVEPGTGRKTNQ